MYVIKPHTGSNKLAACGETKGLFFGRGNKTSFIND